MGQPAAETEKPPAAETTNLDLFCRNSNYVEKTEQFLLKQIIMQKYIRHAKSDQIIVNCLIDQLPNVDTLAENQMLHQE